MNAFPITDGFLYNTMLRPNLTFGSLALDEFEALRRAGAYRTRWLCIPEDPSTTSIPKAGIYEYQTSVIPGSAYWGWIFTAPAAVAGQFSIEITDGCTGERIWETEVNTGTLVSPTSTAAGQLNPGQGKQNLFSKLLVIGKPGTINVLICSLDTAQADSNVQLILCGGQPVPEVCQ